MQGVDGFAADTAITDAGTVGLAVTVGATGDEQCQPACKFGEVIDLRRLMRRVEDLDSVETDIDQSLDDRIRHRQAGVGEDDDTTQLMHHGNHVVSGGSRLGHIGGTAITDEAREGFFLVAHRAAGDHGSGDVWSPERPAISAHQYVLEGDVDAELVEAFDDGDATVVPLLMDEFDVGRQTRIEVVETIGEKMHFPVVEVGAQLGTGDDLDAVGLTGLQGLWYALDRVVIGKAQDPHAAAGGLLHGLCRCAEAVGAERMRV